MTRQWSNGQREGTSEQAEGIEKADVRSCEIIRPSENENADYPGALKSDSLSQEGAKNNGSVRFEMNSDTYPGG